MALLDSSPIQPAECGRTRTQAVAELRAVEREHDAFVRATVHDLINGLAVIRGRAQLLQRRATRQAQVEPTDLAAGLAVVVATVDDLALVAAGLIAEVERLAR